MPDACNHTISGLLRKCADFFNEAERLHDHLAEIRNDICALDRILGAFGYKGDLDAAMPRQKREVLFGQCELTRAIMQELRDAEGPMTSRQIAKVSWRCAAIDAQDRKYVSDLTRRVSKALRAQRIKGRVSSAKDAFDKVV